VLGLLNEVNHQDRTTFLICTHDEHVAEGWTRRITLSDGLVKNAAVD